MGGEHYAELLILVKFVRFYIKQMGINNSGLMLELGVLVGIGRSGVLRGRILSYVIAPLNSFMVPSYDPKTENKYHEY